MGRQKDWHRESKGLHAARERDETFWEDRYMRQVSGSQISAVEVKSNSFFWQLASSLSLVLGNEINFLCKCGTCLLNGSNRMNMSSWAIKDRRQVSMYQISNTERSVSDMPSKQCLIVLYILDSDT